MSGHDLARFIAAQEGVYAQALAELRAGAKRGHWIWFVFPQISGLGMSAMSRRYAIRSLDEARAYLAHPILDARLRECTGAMLAHAGESAEAILGTIDAVKLRSSMTCSSAPATRTTRSPAASTHSSRGTGTRRRCGCWE